MPWRLSFSFLIPDTDTDPVRIWKSLEIELSRDAQTHSIALKQARAEVFRLSIDGSRIISEVQSDFFVIVTCAERHWESLGTGL